MTAPHPLRLDWTTPHGLLSFDAILPEHYVPAFEAAMAARLTELEALSIGPPSPTSKTPPEKNARVSQSLSRAFS
jgi:peptidyl-dipeptidase Dcp